MDTKYKKDEYVWVRVRILEVPPKRDGDVYRIQGPDGGEFYVLEQNISKGLLTKESKKLEMKTHEDFGNAFEEAMKLCKSK